MSKPTETRADGTMIWSGVPTRTMYCASPVGMLTFENIPIDAVPIDVGAPCPHCLPLVLGRVEFAYSVRAIDYVDGVFRCMNDLTDLRKDDRRHKLPPKLLQTVPLTNNGRDEVSLVVYEWEKNSTVQYVGKLDGER